MHKKSGTIPKKTINSPSFREKKYNFLLSEAVEILRRCDIRQVIPVKNLKEAGEKLAEAIDVFDNKVEPFYYLAYVFFQLDKTDLAFKYLKLADAIDPGFPKIHQLKNVILMNHFAKK